MSRWKAALIHLSISATIGLIVGALLLLVWYPPPFFHAAGADELVLLMVGVDIVLGPLLTLIVFRSGKKGLKFDLALIGFVQSAALIYGLSVVLQSRPVFLVGAGDRFTLVSANELEDEDLAKGTKEEFRSMSWTGPRLAASKMPDALEERNALVFAVAKGKDLEKFPQYYRDYSTFKDDMLKRARSIDKLLKQHPAAVGIVDSWMKSHNRDETNTVWVPLNARSASVTMMMDAGSGELLGAVPVDPW